MIKNLIFDFDGTIADDLEQVFEIINTLSSKYGYDDVDEKLIDDFKNKGAKWIFQKLSIPPIKIPFLVSGIRNGLDAKIELTKPQKNIREVILKLKVNKFNLGILTTNSEKNVRRFLIKNNLDVFDFIYSNSNVFGKSKSLVDILKSQNITREETVYIGDEDRDVEAAKEVKIKSVAVTWGFNSKELLGQTKPDYIIDNPGQLLEIFN